MTSKETVPKTTKEKLKNYFWKFLGLAALAVGAVVVINYITNKL